MGRVYLAEDETLGRRVAIKVVSERVAGDASSRQRFLREARAMATVEHPNVVRVYSFGEADRQAYIVMEYVEGETLADRMRREGHLGVDTTLRIVDQVVEGLGAAWAGHLVHRDIKPSNILLDTKSRVRVVDFGLAKPIDIGSDTGLTQAGSILGTPYYVSPEQARGVPVDLRSDVYSLGIVLYEMLVGARPFDGTTPMDVVAKHIHEPLPSVTEKRPEIPAELARLVATMSAKDPAARPGSYEALRQHLDPLIAAIPATPRPAPGGPPTFDREAPTMDLDDEFRPEARPTPLARTAGASLGGMRLLWVGALVIVGLALAWLVGKSLWHGSVSGRPPVVAVLPLTNLTGDARHDVTGVGIAQVVVDSLSQVDGLEVLPRTSTIAFLEGKGDLAGIARRLDASYLVDGVLQGSGEQLRVSLSLVDASSRTVEWGETFDGAFPKVFELQSRVAEAVARAALLRISPEAEARLEMRPTPSPSAWQDYTTALALLDRPDRPGNVAAAIATLERALDVDPRFAKAHAAKADACLRRYDETGEESWADRATESAQEALRLEPGDVEVRRSLALTLASRGRLAEAIDELEQALAQKPSSDGLRRQLSEVLIRVGRPDAALEQAHRAVELRPGYAANHMDVGLAHYAAGRFGEAAAAFRSATELQPDNAWAFHMLGTALHMAGDLDQAAVAYREAIRLAPDARAWANLAAVQYSRGNLVDAIRGFEQAARLEPGSGTIRRSLGDSRAKAGDADGAKAEWRAAIDLSRAALSVNPRDPRQLKNLAICLAKLGEREEALRVAQQALEAGPNLPDTRYGVAMVHALLGDHPRALQLLGEALELGASPALAEQDDELAPLRGLPAFRELIDKARHSKKEVEHGS